jgi:CheY-like chemotaxis protein
MNGIIGFAQMLNKPGISPEKRNEYSSIVKNSSLQLLKIIDDILEISKLETKQLKRQNENFCLNDLLTEIYSTFELKPNPQKIPIYIKKALKDNQSFIFSDKTKLNKVLSNLLDNAIKFTPQGYIELGYNIQGTNLILYVKDTGVGIYPYNQEIIFERFSQEEKNISRKYGGLGLGLSISRENAHILGGEISLESEKGKGTTFYLTIPYTPLNLDTKHQSEDVPINKPPDKALQKTILIAEDEAINYLYIETIFDEFRKNQYQIIHATNGKETIELCTHKVDLVLMDIKMPILDGHEAAKAIKLKYPYLPIIAQTAYSTKEDKEFALKNNFDEFISKPIQQEQLLALIDKYLA